MQKRNIFFNIVKKFISIFSKSSSKRNNLQNIKFIHSKFDKKFYYLRKKFHIHFIHNNINIYDYLWIIFLNKNKSF